MRKASRIIRSIKEGFVKFSSDGCTMAPDFNFRDCCEEHDFDYTKFHRTSEQKRAEIDRKLRLCIKCRGWLVLSWVYWAFARVFGWVFFWIIPNKKERKPNGRS